MRSKSTQELLLLFICLVSVFRKSSESGPFEPVSYRLCIPSGAKTSCDQMVNDPRRQGSTSKIKCIIASGKIGCIEKVLKDEADFLPLEPEEIFVAQKYRRHGFSIIGEIRANEYLTRDYRYEPVALIRKSSGIKRISDLRGKKSCHTGFGRNAGWKIPFSHLLDKNELGGLCNDIEGTTPERDLYAFSKYFGQACAPGPWVPEKESDTNLRSKYSNLCKLCKNPGECNGKDAYAGYEGALKCLTENDGDVAWTKMDAVQKFFKLNEQVPSALAGSFAFLCWDGSSQPLTSPTPCAWAKRPWRAFLASQRLSYEAIADLQNTIKSYVDWAKELRQTNATILDWDIKVLEVNATSESEVPYGPPLSKSVTPYNYLKNKNYTVTIEKSSCAIDKVVRICVKDVIEKLKCLELQLGAIGKRIVPGFDCILGESLGDCFLKVQKGNADVVMSSAKDSAFAKINFGLVPILNALEIIDEPSQEKAPYKFALAVIRNDSAIRNMTDLKGKKSCHGSIRNLGGWNIALNTLRNNGLISGPTCGLPLEMAKFFNGSCVPGILAAQTKMPWLPATLCSICTGDSTQPESRSPGTFCEDGPRERYFGGSGALGCLADQVGDVAFVDHVALLKDSSGVIDLKEVRLLCPLGEIRDIKEYRHCNWGKVSSRKVLARDGDLNKIEREDARLSLLKASDAFSPTGAFDIVPLFESYYTNRDVLFQDSSVGLSNNVPDPIVDQVIDAFDFCLTSNAITPVYQASLRAIIIALFPIFRIVN